MALNDVVALAHLDDGFAALTPKLIHMHRNVGVVPFGAQHHHAVVMTNLDIVTRQLAADVGRTLARFAPHECSQSHQEIGVVVGHVFCAKTMGVVFCNEACVEVAGHKFGVR